MQNRHFCLVTWMDLQTLCLVALKELLNLQSFFSVGLTLAFVDETHAEVLLSVVVWTLSEGHFFVEVCSLFEVLLFAEAWFPSVGQTFPVVWHPFEVLFSVAEQIFPVVSAAVDVIPVVVSVEAAVWFAAFVVGQFHAGVFAFRVYFCSGDCNLCAPADFLKACYTDIEVCS